MYPLISCRCPMFFPGGNTYICIQGKNQNREPRFLNKERIAMIKRTIITGALLLSLLVPASAFAYNITPSNYDSLTGMNTLFGGGNAALKTVDGYLGLGVSGGVNGEISIEQSITFNFDTAQTINSVSLNALFADGNYGDVGNEVAQITAYSGSTSWTYTLTAGVDSAVWTGLGSVSGLEANAGLQGNGGVWEIINPFGDVAIDSLVFTSLHNGIADNAGSQNSDYGVQGISTTATPIPAAAWLLGSGLFGLIGLRRRGRA